jgi:iduronate 2-sulfatase
MIIFTSDHGDALGDHGLAFKSFYYESMAHVPLIIRGPGVAAGRRCAALVSTLDLVPLFYHTCGVTPPTTLESADITPLLADPAGTIRDLVFCENLGTTMVRDERYKYAHYANGDCELYDLVTDPTEEQNLASDPAHQATVLRMRAHILDHTLRTHEQRAKKVERAKEPARARLDAEYQRRQGAQS